MGLIEKPVFALDGDGVIFNYDKGYIDNWEKAFGWRPELKNPHSILVTQKYGVPELSGDELLHFRTFFDAEFWETLDFLPGAQEACRMLGERYRLFCVTAMDHLYGVSRHRNLGDLPFVSVITTPTRSDYYDRTTHPSPKAEAVMELKAVGFADDYLPFHRGIDSSVHRALIAPYAHTPEYQSTFKPEDVKEQVDGVYNSLLHMAEVLLAK